VKEFHSDKVTSKFERGDGARHHAAVQGGVAPSARSSASARSSCSSPTRSSCHRVPEDQVHHPPVQEIWMLASISSDAAFLYNSSRIHSSSFPLSFVDVCA
jgi:hypothetical protein